MHHVIMCSCLALQSMCDHTLTLFLAPAAAGATLNTEDLQLYATVSGSGEQS